MAGLQQPCPLDGKEDECKGIVQTYLPASAFTACSTNKWPENSLFRDVDATSVSFDDLKRYKPLVLALYDLSPMGEFTTGFLEKVFLNLDQECDHNLSHGRYIRDKAKWANTEAYCLFGLLSYARKYWRKSLCKKNVTEMAGELQAVMVKNPKKARHTCTREYRQLRAEQPQDSVEASEAATPVTIAAAETAMVWEISDGEDEPSDSGEHGCPAQSSAAASHDGGAHTHDELMQPQLANTGLAESDHCVSDELRGDYEQLVASEQPDSGLPQSLDDDQPSSSHDAGHENIDKLGDMDVVGSSGASASVPEAPPAASKDEEVVEIPDDASLCASTIALGSPWAEDDDFFGDDGGDHNDQAPHHCEEPDSGREQPRPMEDEHISPADESQALGAVQDEDLSVGPAKIGDTPVSEILESFCRGEVPPDNKELYNLVKDSYVEVYEAMMKKNIPIVPNGVISRCMAVISQHDSGSVSPQASSPGDQEPCSVKEPETYRGTLRRLGRFSEEDIPPTQLSDEEKPALKDVMRSKYNPNMDREPDFMRSMQILASTEDPPNYASQGADVGRTRGRKPNRSNPKSKKVRSKKGKKGTVTKGRKGSKVKHVRKPKKAMKNVSQDGSHDSPSKTSKPRKKRVGKFDKLNTRPCKGRSTETGATHEPEPSVDQPMHHGPRRVPPAHITANHVYSSAYRHNKSLGQEYARAAGKLAAATFRDLGYVDDLCGVFRMQPRSKGKGAAAVEED